jgi:hypothetical protein
MPDTVDFGTVSTVGLESSPVAAALTLAECRLGGATL